MLFEYDSSESIAAVNGFIFAAGLALLFNGDERLYDFAWLI